MRKSITTMLLLLFLAIQSNGQSYKIPFYNGSFEHEDIGLQCEWVSLGKNNGETCKRVLFDKSNDGKYSLYLRAASSWNGEWNCKTKRYKLSAGDYNFKFVTMQNRPTFSGAF